jgi:hypothetical protein
VNLVLGAAVAPLQLACKLLAAAIGDVEIINGELAPFLARRAQSSSVFSRHFRLTIQQQIVSHQ